MDTIQIHGLFGEQALQHVGADAPIGLKHALQKLLSIIMPLNGIVALFMRPSKLCFEILES